MKFTPTKDFWCEELKSQYCAGLTYTVRPANDPALAGDDKLKRRTRENRAKLAELVKAWRAEGKVKAVDSDLPEASMIGAGKVG
jgi:hypothetical protein